MKKFDRLCGVIIGLTLFAALLNICALKANASFGSGWEGATRKAISEQDLAVRRITASSTTGTAIWAASKTRPDGVCFNNSAYTVWIGTASGSYFAVEHPNITNGFPILSSGTFNLDGSMLGAAYVTSGVGVATADIRCLDGQDNP